MAPMQKKNRTRIQDPQSELRCSSLWEQNGRSTRDGAHLTARRNYRPLLSVVYWCAQDDRTHTHTHMRGGFDGSIARAAIGRCRALIVALTIVGAGAGGLVIIN